MSWWKDILKKAAGCPGPIQPPQPPTTGPCRVPLKYCYYGTIDDQLQRTYDHVNLVHIGAWGDWVTAPGRAALTDSIIATLHQATAHDPDVPGDHRRAVVA